MNVLVLLLLLIEDTTERGSSDLCECNDFNAIEGVADNQHKN